MVQRIEHIVLPDSDSDLYLTQAVARLSSNPAAREVARAWLAAYDVAHGGGAHQAQSIGKAEQSFHFAVDVSTRCAAPGQAEGRANPVWYECSTWLGIWTTQDRITWRTTDGDWVAQLERSVNGRHVSLALYKQAVYVGRQDATGFHVPSRPRRAKRPRALARSLPLPLAGWAMSAPGRTNGHIRGPDTFVHLDVLSAFLWNQMSTGFQHPFSTG